MAPGAKNYITVAGAQKLRDDLRQLVEIKRPASANSSDDPDVKRQLARLDQRIMQLEESLQSAGDHLAAGWTGGVRAIRDDGDRAGN